MLDEAYESGQTRLGDALGHPTHPHLPGPAHRIRVGLPVRVFRRVWATRVGLSRPAPLRGVHFRPGRARLEPLAGFVTGVAAGAGESAAPLRARDPADSRALRGRGAKLEPPEARAQAGAFGERGRARADRAARAAEPLVPRVGASVLGLRLRGGVADGDARISGAGSGRRRESRARALELLRGGSARELEGAARANGKAIAGYFDPGFEIERMPSADPGPSSLSVLRFYESGKITGSAIARAGNPFRFEDLTFHLVGYVPGSAQGVSLVATESRGGAERSFRPSRSASLSVLRKFSFKVLEIQPRKPRSTALPSSSKYREEGKAPEQFWVFADFPDYDFAHRRARAALHAQGRAPASGGRASGGPRTGGDAALGRSYALGAVFLGRALAA